MNAEAVESSRPQTPFELSGDGLDAQLAELDDSLVKALTIKSIPTKHSRIIGTYGLPAAAITGATHGPGGTSK